MGQEGLSIPTTVTDILFEGIKSSKTLPLIKERALTYDRFFFEERTYYIKVYSCNANFQIYTEGSFLLNDVFSAIHANNRDSSKSGTPSQSYISILLFPENILGILPIALGIRKDLW